MKTKPAVIILLLNLLLVGNLSAQVIEVTGHSDSLTVPKEQFTFTGYAEMNYYRHYLWRGALWGSNDVSQPELHIDYKNFWVSVCTNLNLRPQNLSLDYHKRKVVFDEQDFEVGYQNEIGNLEYRVSLAGYFYFNQLESPSTGEFIINLQYPVWKNVKVFTESAADVASYRGSFYNSTGFIYEKEVGDVSIECKAFGGFASSIFNSVYYGTDGEQLNLVGTNMYIQYNLVNNVYVGANAEYNHYVNKSIREVTGLKKTTNFSVHVGIEF